MTKLRVVLSLLFGAVPAGLALGYLAGWFDPCIQPSRYEPGPGDPDSDMPPFSLAVCDYWPSTLETTLHIAIAIALFLLAGLIAAFVARRAHFAVSAAAAALTALISLRATGYFYPYPRPAVYANDPGLGDTIIFIVAVSLIGVMGGWIARKLTNKPTATPS
jgi:hypothetical protein